MIFQVLEPPAFEEREIAVNPDAATIEETVRGLAWADITFVLLQVDDDTYIEGSGSLNPSDGLSAKYCECGDEHVSVAAPESLDAIIALLRSDAASDGQWRTMFEWD